MNPAPKCPVCGQSMLWFVVPMVRFWPASAGAWVCVRCAGAS